MAIPAQSGRHREAAHLKTSLALFFVPFAPFVVKTTRITPSHLTHPPSYTPIDNSSAKDIIFPAPHGALTSNLEKNRGEPPMAKSNVRIPLPTDPSEAITLLKKVKAKHEDLGTASPLAGLKWGEISPALATAGEQDALSDSLRKQAEKATEARDAKMPVVTEALRSARDVLFGLNRDNPRVLGDYGFTVDDSPRPADKSKDAKS